jgi:hypothetical protein
MYKVSTIRLVAQDHATIRKNNFPRHLYRTKLSLKDHLPIGAIQKGVVRGYI